MSGAGVLTPSISRFFGITDLATLLTFTGVFAPLADPAEFARSVSIREGRGDRASVDSGVTGNSPPVS